MTRKVYIKHLSDQCQSPPHHVKSVKKSDEGFRFIYHYEQQSQQCEVSIHVLTTCLDDYPRGNSFIVYTEDDCADPIITDALQHISERLNNLTIADVLSTISSTLSTALTNGLGSVKTNKSTSPEQNSDFEDFMEVDDSDNDEAFDLHDAQPLRKRRRVSSSTEESSRSIRDSIKIQMWHDLHAVREAGFRVGILGDLEGGGLICVSIRVAKLGISGEAMRAWGIRAKQYLVMMIKFRNGYRSFVEIKDMVKLRGSIEIRVSLCDKYKPTFESAISAFAPVKIAESGGKQHLPEDESLELQPLFISPSLNDMIRDKFTTIIKYRTVFNYNWLNAENFARDLQYESAAEVDPREYTDEDKASRHALPAYVLADELADNPHDPSFPLVAMQFVLRHVVRCTEFCLVCHRKTEGGFEALKPYVCSEPLCLYQYMQLGFGTSIEWEILSQPYVVDLLICFCHSAARHGRLKEFPQGMDLKVPLLPTYENLNLHHVHQHQVYPVTTSPEPANKITQKHFNATLDPATSELIIEQENHKKHAPVREGDWLVVTSDKLKCDIHFYVEDVHMLKCKLGPPIYSALSGTNAPSAANTLSVTSDSSLSPDTAAPVPLSTMVPAITQVKCYRYDQSFDSASPRLKQVLILSLLDTLPSVTEMKQYLSSQPKNREPRLTDWRNRISETALNLLRWVIASNRSCIMQVDQILEKDDEENAKPSNKTPHWEDRVGGMDEYMQFRFAQGAPDKEQRFIEAVETYGKTDCPQYPTIFAWHGSPVYNWHGIIRQGLRFDEILNGRANGNGVYMAPCAQTSLGFCNRGTPNPKNTWQNSRLKVSTAFSLNEVVNARKRFVSSLPHYVVSEIDWIQTRYLFVKTAIPHKFGKEDFSQFDQDPAATAFDAKNKKIRIPVAASPTAAKLAMQESDIIDGLDEDSAESCASDCEYFDTAIETSSVVSDMSFVEPATTISSCPSQTVSLVLADKGQTDFQPNSLDTSSIKILEPPTYATTQATTSLMRLFAELIKVQASTPLHKLGWYIDPESIDNMYQWIVELHSFDQNLPLAKDMKIAGLTSIVLEMRFAEDFPFSPPFIRVVRPRFLPFLQGGGGHVTEGGAICMELLTNNGWSATNSIETVLFQVRMAISDDKRPARLLNTMNKSTLASKHQMSGSYAIGDAIAAYERACKNHGWTVPKSFSSLSRI